MIILPCVQFFLEGGYVTYIFLLMFFFGLIYQITRWLR